jgi:hypothetical protein
MRKGPAILLFATIFAVMTPVTTGVLFWIQRGIHAFEKAAPPDYVAEVEPVLREFCYDCHSDGANKGGFALDEHINLTLLKGDRIHWTRVIDNLDNGTMPPAGKPRPSPDQIATLERWIDLVVFQHDCGEPDPGRVTIRRLNREEYNNTVHELTGVKFRPADDFPADDTGYGFDNIGDVLSLSPVLLEKYLKAAVQVLDEAMPTEPDSGETMKVAVAKLEQKGPGGVRGDVRALISGGEIFGNFTVKTGGDYRISFLAYGDQAGSEPVKAELRVDDRKIKVLEIPQRSGAPGRFEAMVRLEAGRRRITTAFINDFYDASKREDRNFYVGDIVLTGPFSKRPETAFQKRLLEPVGKHRNQEDAAEEILSRFATKAFRRPATDDEVEGLLKLHSLARENGDSFEGGIKLALSATLVSPKFLFRGEVQPDPDNPEQVHEIDDYALASRLSYFLWSSMPDDKLFELAEKKLLRRDLPGQVARMLADPKASALAANFGGQWLQLRNLELVQPNPKLFPGFDPELRAAMRRESEMLFEKIMSEDRSVEEFINADYTHVNERLAKHYGIDGIRGKNFHKVSLADTARRGVLSHASVLTVTSHPDRTSPVKRGQWVLDNLLGTPPPPAPPDVPTLEDNGRKLTGSLRQQMEQHRENKVCASCHQLMDPIGFGLENFDPLGRWRAGDDGQAINPSGTLSTGETFQGPRELVDILAGSRRDFFLRNLVRKMLTYSLGRGLEYYDKCAVKEIVAKLEAGDLRFSALVTGIVESVPFQMRRGERSGPDS